jgi:TRAP-type mannitol/chloroaromatic compound transport system permease large subunit
MATIFRSAVPFICLQAVGNALCIVFPQIILYLPSKFYAGH